MYGNSMRMGYGPGISSMQYGVNSTFSAMNQGKGKGKEVDFEAAFAQFSESLESVGQQTSRIEEVRDDVADITDALKGVTVEETETDFQRYVYPLQR